MDVFPAEGGDYGDAVGLKKTRDTVIQLGISVILGLGAFLGFCIIRPRWPGLYAARKKQRNQAEPLPDLPDTMFGWMPTLWKVTEQQVLASAGLDAYVFLRFFRMAIKFLTATLFFGLVVVKPVHDAFPDKSTQIGKNNTHHDPMSSSVGKRNPISLAPFLPMSKDGRFPYEVASDYLWMYLVLAYLFTVLAIYLLVTETEGIIGIRQGYLGSQATVTDRTIRLSGIPSSLRSEDKIKTFVEGLEIGKVESVTLCRKWARLDNMMDARTSILRKLEESWTVFLGKRRESQKRNILPTAQIRSTINWSDEAGDEEDGPLLDQSNELIDDPDVRARPKATLRYGFMKLRSKYVDAIDYYEEKLRTTDEDIVELRKKDFEPTPIAFVTMDSVAACQMAVQAVLDPSPMQLIASLSPAPVDVIWRNTYLPRSRRMLRGWTVTVVIIILTVFWSILLAPIAGALNVKAIGKIFPGLGHALEYHPYLASLVSAQLPTLLVTLLFVAVPYLYDWLANLQGMTSQGDVELSVISKNFFFTFFNYFLIFTIFSTASNFYTFWQNFRDSLQDTTKIAYLLAQSVQGVQPFYTNLIILQGLGLFPLRLLEFGSVALYPIYRLGAKTPRDYAELVQPPIFNYGFYLPQVLLIFIICIVYSVLRESWKVLLAGLVYFILGGFVYKYQLLYAMDHRQHSTGKAWVMICNRVIIGLAIFQITTAGQLALQKAFGRSLAIVPLFIATVWFSYYYSRHYTPLMNFISLRSIERRLPDNESNSFDPDGWGEQARLRYESESHRGRTANETRESGMRFVNPSLVTPLEKVWIADESVRENVRASSPQRRLVTTLNAL